MNTPLEVIRTEVLAGLSHDQLRRSIDQVVSGDLAGIVISDEKSRVFRDSIKYASELGLSGGINSTTMTFNYDDTVSDLAAAQTRGEAPGPEDWSEFGVTSLHTDGIEGDEMLSISRCTLGSYVINIFNRGPAIKQYFPMELWDVLQDDNFDILLDGEVNTDRLSNTMTRLEVRIGQTAIFNPSQPHMGITTTAPRRVDTTFFQHEPGVGR
jgi:hypothetical protein